LISDWLFSILVAPNFRSYAGLLGYVVMAGGLFAAAQLLSLRTHADMTVRRTIPVKIGSAIAGTMLNLLFARRWGITGVVGSVLGFSIIYLCWTILLIRRIEFERHGSCRSAAHA
jgi:O-antigen/teichoic acid export membrane protein